MIAFRSRMLALYYLLKVVALFALGIIFFRWALTLGLTYFFVVLPEWFLWTLVILSAVRYQYDKVCYRSATYTQDTVYWYHRSEPRYIAEFVEFLCVKRRLHLPRIALVKEHAASMLDDLQRPDLLIIGEDAISALSPEQLKGVIAHELRHSDATDTKLVHLFNLLTRIFSRLWRWGGVTYVMLCGMGFTHRAFMVAWGIGLFILFHVVTRLILLGMSRAMEYKTDILACLDTREPEIFLSALSVFTFDGLYRTSFRRSPFDPEDRIAEWFDRIFHTHPSYRQRYWSLERIYGPMDIRREVEEQSLLNSKLERPALLPDRTYLRLRVVP